VTRRKALKGAAGESAGEPTGDITPKRIRGTVSKTAAAAPPTPAEPVTAPATHPAPAGVGAPAEPVAPAAPAALAAAAAPPPPPGIAPATGTGRRPPTSVLRALLLLAGRHLWITVAAGSAALCGLLEWLLGNGLAQYFEAQGMDDERAYLLTAMVLVILATAVLGAASRRPAPTRVGGLVGFVGIQIIPFLVRAANQPPLVGLRYQQNVLGWILQPLGMLLLALIGVIVGAALGVGLARDATHLPDFFRRRRFWPAIPVAIALVVVATGAAVTALQDGPLGALRTIDVGPGPAAALVATPTPEGSAGSSAGAPVPTPDVPLLREIPGRIQYLTIANRPLDVYVPGVYFADPTLSLPVLYLLHGSPGGPSDYFNGGSLEAVLDQMIGKGTIPPVIAVLPNGNTAQSTDTQWGDSPVGQIESWIVNQVVPGIDAQYRTLGAGYRGIAGLSSGGFGALNIAFQNPTVFSWAGSYSGYFVGNSSIFGSAWRANSPLYTASSVPVAERMPIYLGAGSTDYTFKPDTVQFNSTLTTLGWPEVDLQTVPGGHGWVAWEAEMVQSFAWLGQLWGAQPWSAPATALQTPPSVAAAGNLTSRGSL
jgi:enterochelin esterase-like enzyme